MYSDDIRTLYLLLLHIVLENVLVCHTETGVWYYKYNCTFLKFTLSFIHLAVSLTTDPKPLPKRALHIVRSRASSFGCEYSLLPLRSCSSFIRLLPRLPVTSIPSFVFPSITCHRRQFLRKMWPIQLAFRLLISCRIFLCSLTLSTTSSFLTLSVQLIFSILLQHHILKLSRCFWFFLNIGSKFGLPVWGKIMRQAREQSRHNEGNIWTVGILRVISGPNKYYAKWTWINTKYKDTTWTYRMLL
jgi:hypothetical protein